MRTHLAFLTTAAALLLAAPAAAGDDLALMGTAAFMPARNGLGEGFGGGAEARMIDDTATIGLSAFAIVGQTPTERRRDLMDVRFDAGLRLCERCEHVSPYVSLGLDVLHVTTHEPTRSVRGSTLGLSAHAGVMGSLGDDWLWRAGATYLGAIVPGTGDDLGGVTLSVAFGKRILD